MKSATRIVRDPILVGIAIAATLVGLLFIFDAGYARSLRDGRGIIPREFIIQAITLPVAAACGWFAAKSAGRDVQRQATQAGER